MHTFEVLKRPLVTEKTTLMGEQSRYVFEVAKNATKHDVMRAVEVAFEVKVLSVNTMIVKGKTKRFGPRFSTGKSWKKAIVTLTLGQKITFFEGV